MYWALFRTSGGSIGPRQADELELWEIAVLLQGPETWGQEPEASEGKPKKETDRHAHLRARLAHAYGQGPKFEWEEPTEAEKANLTALVNSLG